MNTDRFSEPRCPGLCLPGQRFPARASLAAAVLAVALAAPLAHAQQVTYFAQPPSSDQVQQALHPTSAARAAGNAAGRPRSRGIDWNAGQGQGASAAPPQLIQAGQMPQPAAQGGTGTAQEGAQVATERAGDSGPAIAMPVAFDVGSARLAPGATAFLESIAGALNADPSLHLAIEGHTDAAGSARANMMLSWDRAMTVFRTLVERFNIDPARLRPMGKGSSEPMAGTSPLDRSNRRVQFRVEG